ncbi:MAG TPA: Grx4 family monothiol glutaredoxin [Gammaproteobacteria bacterium]|nr:Grx4 family monothiol glutaredoxin [Gammaproteobacteria bacterium]
MNAIEPGTLERIKRQISSNTVLLYMKGSPDFPMCGFSGRVIQILDALKTKYAYVNILENPDIRATLPSYAKWPTFPQLYIQGELIGGCDIVSELHQKGELKSLLENAQSLMGAKPEAALASE